MTQRLMAGISMFAMHIVFNSSGWSVSIQSKWQKIPFFDTRQERSKPIKVSSSSKFSGDCPIVNQYVFWVSFRVTVFNPLRGGLPPLPPARYPLFCQSALDWLPNVSCYQHDDVVCNYCVMKWSFFLCSVFIFFVSLSLQNMSSNLSKKCFNNNI